MRFHQAIARGVLAAAVVLTLPACLPDQCKTKSANLELTIAFSGFSLSNARRVEFETEVDAPGPTSTSTQPYYERRLGSVAYPNGLTKGEITFLINTGTYLNNLTQPAYGYRIFVRVYGERNGHADALLAEGHHRWSGLSAKECYIDERMKVTASSTCANKFEGEPCVSPDQGWQPRGVCVLSGDDLQCRPSACGDGFTDRRAGEACDPGDPADPTRACAEGCFATPRTAVVSTGGVTPPEISQFGTVQGMEPGLTEAPGIWSLDATDAGDLHGSLLVADLDGDGTDELFLGLAGARYDHPNETPATGCPGERVGVVYGYDWPMVGERRYGRETGPHVRINGPCSAKSSRGASFGTSLAAGDLDGDGALDLVVGAPRADGNDTEKEGGEVYVLFGGSNSALSGSTQSQMDVRGSSLPLQTYVGTYGFWNADSPGEWLGYAVAVADFDLDGYADLALAAPQLKAASLGRRGGVYLLRGGPEFREQAPIPVEVATLASFQVESGFERGGERLGVSLATGDVNGDGYPDLVMGTIAADASGHSGGLTVLFGHDTVFERDTGNRSPKVFPFTDVGEGDLVSIDVSTLGLEGTLQGLGGTVAVVDLDDDGRAEVVATLGRGPFGDAPGRVAILRGTYFEDLYPLRSIGDVTAPDPTELTLIEGPADSDFGLTLAVVDVSGDRRPDLLIGAPGETYDAPPAAPIPQAGAVYALLATPNEAAGWFSPEGTGVLDLVALRQDTTATSVPISLLWLRGTSPGGRFGTAMAGSSHLSQTDYRFEHRNAYTYVFEPGQPSAGGAGDHGGRVWSFFLPALLPCDSESACVPRSSASPTP